MLLEPLLKTRILVFFKFFIYRSLNIRSGGEDVYSEKKGHEIR